MICERSSVLFCFCLTLALQIGVRYRLPTGYYHYFCGTQGVRHCRSAGMCTGQRHLQFGYTSLQIWMGYFGRRTSRLDLEEAGERKLDRNLSMAK